MSNETGMCEPSKKLTDDPCNCDYFYNAGHRQRCGNGTTSINGYCKHADKLCFKNPWFRCGINIYFEKKKCRNVWPKEMESWNRTKINRFLSDHSTTMPSSTMPSSTTSSSTTMTIAQTKSATIPIAVSLGILLPLLAIAIYLFWRWKSGKNINPFHNPGEKLNKPVARESSAYEEISIIQKSSIDPADGNNTDNGFTNKNDLNKGNLNFSYSDENDENVYSNAELDTDVDYNGMERDSGVYSHLNVIKLELMDDSTFTVVQLGDDTDSKYEEVPDTTYDVISSDKKDPQNV